MTKQYVCAGCAAAKPGTRLPRGWKSLDQLVYCAACWSRDYMIRAVTIPVAGPVDATWPELREALKQSFRDATRLANWAIRELARLDAVRTPEMSRMPACPAPYLYPEARTICPELSPQSVVSILHAASGKYRMLRYDTIWRGEASLPNFRYPTPLPLHNRSWSYNRGPNGEPLISARIGDRRCDSARAATSRGSSSSSMNSSCKVSSCSWSVVR